MTAQPDAVSLREITKDTVKSILALEVAEGQEDLVGDNGNSLALALFEEKAWYRGIYSGDEPVGFLMLSIDRDFANPRSARKFMKITTSLSEIGGYSPAPTSVGFTNSSSSPLSYAAFNAVSASLNENSLLDSVNNS